MQSETDSVDATVGSELRRSEREDDGETVQVTIPDTDEDNRIFVKADHFYEFTAEDGLAHPHWTCNPLPDWMESLLTDLGVNGIRNAKRDE